MQSVPDYLSFWGKSRVSESGLLISHPAALHMLDVAAVAWVWLLAERPFVPGVGAWQDSYSAPLAVLIALHDIGKFSHPFQAKVEALWPQSLGPYKGALPMPRHDHAGYALLQEEAFAARFAPFLPGLKSWQIKPIWRATCGHHGSPPPETPADERAFSPASNAAALAFVDDLLALLTPEPLTVHDSKAFSWWLAGVTTLADWVGSSESWFSYPASCANLVEYWPQACAKAQKSVAQAGLLPIPPVQAMTYQDLIGPVEPTPLQKFVAEMDLPDGPLLVLIEDQMGSGKTEAALMLAYRLMRSKGAEGLFIALPTMATANALYERLAKVYASLFMPEGKPSLILAHGKRHLNDHFTNWLHGQEDAAQKSQADEDADETGSAQTVAWIGDDRRRSFLANCGAGTIDQAVLSVLPSRHAPLRLLGLTRHVLVIDEAHAYDEYITEELRRLVTFQAKQGGSTIILSATLPHQVRKKLVEAFGSAGHCQPHGYPLVTIASKAQVAEHPVAPRQALERTIKLSRLNDVAQALEVVLDAAAKGSAVGWVRNTVKDAIAAHAELVAKGVKASLFHARFAMGDRLEREAQVQSWFGKNSASPERGHVLVGTQVVEQSLDIDFDVLISDLAPVDLLLQRAGRLWRHQRTTRPEPSPRFFIVSPEPVTNPPASWMKDFRGTEAVYKNTALLWRSVRALFAKPTLALPQDVRRLVEEVYDPEAEIPTGLANSSQKAEGEGKAKTGIAWQNLMNWDFGYARANGKWESDLTIPTRLADPSLSYRLAVWDGGELYPLCPGEKAWAMSEITLPLRLAKSLPEERGVRQAALQKLLARWSRWERDLPVLILMQDGDVLVGEVIDQKERVCRVTYSQEQGLIFTGTS